MHDPANYRIYDGDFYTSQADGSKRSASLILSRLYAVYKPVSVVDVGCGRGAWLAACEELGSAVLKGFDGDWVANDSLLSKTIDFTPVDLESRIRVSEKFDLAISLEVAEHLAEEGAARFVNDLCNASDVVVFGAAAKNQEGRQHINEQWQSYWIELFEKNSYECFDVFRGYFWNNSMVDWWYRQNTFLFVNKNKEVGPHIERSQLKTMEKRIFDVVHPENLESKLHKYRGAARGLSQIIDEPTYSFCYKTIQTYLSRKTQAFLAFKKT